MTLENMHTPPFDDIPDSKSLIVACCDRVLAVRCKLADGVGVALQKMDVVRVVLRRD